MQQIRLHVARSVVSAIRSCGVVAIYYLRGTFSLFFLQFTEMHAYIHIQTGLDEDMRTPRAVQQTSKENLSPSAHTATAPDTSI